MSLEEPEQLGVDLATKQDQTVLSVWLDPSNYKYEAHARIEGQMILDREARKLGWKNWKFGFRRDEVAGCWHAWIWQESLI